MKTVVYWTILLSAVVLKKIVFVVGFAIGIVFGLAIRVDSCIHAGFDNVIKACRSELGVEIEAEIDPQWEIPVDK